MKWTGRIDSNKIERFHQAVKFQSLENLSLDSEFNFAFCGFASDAGVIRNKGRPGAKLGPDAIRKVLSNLPLPRKDSSYVDIGDIEVIDDRLEEGQEALSVSVEHLLRKQFDPIILGGGHESAWGHFLGIARAYPDNKIAIVNLDAHFDMRPDSMANSGTSFKQMGDFLNSKFSYTCIGLQPQSNTETLFQIAKEYHSTWFTAEEIHLNGTGKALEHLKRIIDSHEVIFFTICLDVFALPYAPGVSAPQPLGITPWQAIPLVREMSRSDKVKGINISELSPPHDRDEATARLAASLIYEWIQSRYL